MIQANKLYDVSLFIIHDSTNVRVNSFFLFLIVLMCFELSSVFIGSGIVARHTHSRAPIHILRLSSQ